MTDEDVNVFGAQPEPDPEPEPSGNVIPFPRMRPNTKLAEVWSTELARLNDAGNTHHQFASPLDVVPHLMDLRAMPPMPWPADWPELGRRVRTYAGDLVGVVGAIGGGKTSFAIQCTRACMGAGHPALWANLELTKVEVVTRLVGNLVGSHAHVVRDHWDRPRIEHVLNSVSDMWRFVDRHPNPEEQLAAMEDAIRLAWKVYRVPPVLVVDHIGQLVIGQRDERHAVMQNAESLRAMAERNACFIIVLVQASVANQAVLTGRVEPESAADVLGIETGGKAIASAAANNISLSVFKADDAPRLNAHALVTKARHTGLEGKVGMRFNKPGGVWEQLDYLPATPSEIRVEVEKAKKDKHRSAPTTPAQVSMDLNASLAGDAAATRRTKIYEALTSHGMIGMHINEIRKVKGAGRGALVHQALQELEHAGSAMRLPDNRWRVVVRASE